MAERFELGFCAHVTKPHHKEIPGAGERSQRLRALTAFLEDLGEIPSTHMAAHKCLSLQLQEIWYACLASVSTRHTHNTHTYVQANHS